ncbi:hypothetical protein SB6411_00254 [Klebsiella spallanzanii]|uniref:Uncharacterized protein n=1 Tax=Klebsiella spallanzanii TaxID=2587528 RepID=A0ABY6V475_9ENTR|nr:hypothetical protein [Klebsiella spallanzanii]VUS22872.1 hypothetical protein SB6411_00254 [Klebsiella spallanzanii]
MESKKSKLIDFKEFGHYLNSLVGDHVCPICNTDEWTLYTPDELTKDAENAKVYKVIPSLPLVSYSEDNDKKKTSMVSSEALDILIMQCSNCGYINLFSHRKVSKNIETGDYKKLKSEENKEHDSSENE